MDSYYLSLLEGAGGVRRERLPGGLGQAQLAAGNSNQGGGVVRNMCETCGEAGEFSRGKSISYLTAFLRNLNDTYKKQGAHPSSQKLFSLLHSLDIPSLPMRQRQHASPCYHRRCCLRFSQESEPGMTARTLDGQKIRDQIFAELSDEVRLLTAAGVRPGLAAVLVGENPASQLYVKSKIAACQQLGLSSALLTPPATATTQDLLAVVDGLNRDNNVDGILIQLPLPPHVDTKRILEAVHPNKDVDGFHPVNLGRLVSGRLGLV